MMLRLAKLGIAMAVLALLIVPAAYAGVPDITKSYFVPQAGPLTTPCEGLTSAGVLGVCLGVPANGNLPTYSSTPPGAQAGGAIGCAYTCPNNDGGQVLRNWARLKIVVMASDGTPIANIPAADICALFNGGTAIQGFSGVGADMIVADPQFSGGPAGGCPAVRCVQADAPTDATGTTFITWIGHQASDPPGMGNRDPLRKWGGYDSEIPIMVLGYKLRGQLATTGLGAVAGNYNAIVRNFDMSGSYFGTLGTAERVSNPADPNYFTARLTPPNPAVGALTSANATVPPGGPGDPRAVFGYDADFNGNGTVASATDGNIFNFHVIGTHTCIFPLNP